MSNDELNGRLAKNNVALQIALDRLTQAKVILAANEASLAMVRDMGDTKAIRSVQARVNGLRTKVGRAAFSVRQAGGIA
jgi:hypothetical protein